jgi:hypothetical protein
LPAVLDTGNNHNFSIGHSHLVRWAGIQPRGLRQLRAVRERGKRIPLHAARLWLHPNVPGKRQVAGVEPIPLKIEEGIAIYPDGDAPRLPVLELSSISDAELLALNEVALVPLLPLTSSQQKPQTLLEQCKARIEQHARPEERATLLTITAIFATMRYPRAEEWLTMLGGKTMLSQSPLYQKWMDENTCATRQDAIIRILKARFDEAPEELAAQIRTVSDLEQLERGIDHAALCISLKDFRKRLAKG